MKKIIIALVSVLSITTAQAQTLEEGIQMYKYERFQSAKRILTPLATSNPVANYYLGLSELGDDNNATAKSIFQKFPDDPANQAGLARILIIEKKTPEAVSMLQSVASKAKKKNF
ncbi:MAG: hypothetical protein IT215_03390, partial [Chitinophagaceae bacterium]|nr:hypothetical protein [Chitinophagaceae bacterium]